MLLLNDMHTDWDKRDEDNRPAITTLFTNGRGYWTTLALSIRVTELRVAYINEDCDFGELCVHYNTSDWRCDSMGLIYTDPLFMEQLKKYLTGVGLNGADVSYSEQGMQGDNYVSCDVGKDFLDSWNAKYPENYDKVYNETNN